MKTTVVTFLAMGLLAINSFALALDSNPIPEPWVDTPSCEISDSSFSSFGDEGTAECLSKCKKEFRKCSDGGTKNVPACLEKQKKCYDKCP